ncbi:hypothetical protein COEREDRAFT_87687 [Coemansia reversa NRRL 1564]|uniref:F-box domain-containing protein n=1 Tax=Coemansia reversa (strain ATCC 12441 / NRRL 1564) TaxID=763665 RepID=A0A2G5B9N2_COERN|nr:hypothetical protein COEREDRAFT_87687 [Coemansia reversa NRRL 1564]|eukprot:PIA15729.1 hypothetical protein COEREDRAFT_87687 [Coemansia reversa NRRL 1564]
MAKIGIASSLQKLIYLYGLYDFTTGIVEPAISNITSNMDIVLANGYSHMVGRLQVDLSYVFDPFPVLFALIDFLKKTSNLDHPEFVASMDKVVCALTEQIPYLKKLKLLGFKDNKPARRILGQYASRIINQICGLKSSYPLIFDTPTFSENLSYLNMNFDNEANYQLPQVYTASLRYLRLYNTPVLYSWNQFVRDMSADIIDFRSLETLDISYKSWDLIENKHIESRPPFKRIHVRFTKLQALYISNCTGYCPVLEDGQFPAKMQLIRFSGIVPAIESLAHVKLKSVESLKVCVKRAIKSYKYNPTLTLAHIFNSIDVNQIAELLVYDIFVHINPADLDCTYMTRLSISASTNCLKLFQLVCKLPNILELKLDDLTGFKVPQVARMIESDDKSRIRVISIKTRLQKLYLRYDVDANTVGEIKSMVLYLILGISTLRVISLPTTTISELDLSVTKYYNFYPHLKNICYLATSIEL